MMVLFMKLAGDIPVWDNETGTDAEAVNNGYISLTPLGFELTRSETFPRILNWLEENNLLQLES